jgi:2-keto-4-pentenoate hydratase
MNSHDFQGIANQMKAAQDKGLQIEPFTSQLKGFDISSAYEVAHLIHEARLDEGAVPVGRKIGFTNPDMWSRYGVREPIWAYIYDTTVVHLSAKHEKCSIRRFIEPKIEPEIVFHFHSAPPVIGTDLVETLESFSISLSCDGEVREVGRGSNVLGSPLAAIAHLIAVLGKQTKYKPLQANEMVTTGTITTALSIHAGETWRTELEGIALPGLSVEFTA